MKRKSRATVLAASKSLDFFHSVDKDSLFLGRSSVDSHCCSFELPSASK